MTKIILALTILFSMFSGNFTGSELSLDSFDIETNVAEEMHEIEDNETDELRQDAIEVIIPDWITYQLPDGIVDEFVYFGCEYKYILEGENCKLYYIDKDEYSDRVDRINPPDFAMVTEIYPEDYTMVESLEINENGDTINIVISHKGFFQSFERNSVENIAYQCAIAKCIQGVNKDDINIELNYTISNSSEKVSYSLPYRLHSVVDSTDDMQQEFNIHVPVECLIGSTELTKETIEMAGVTDITVNSDGSLDYTATKALIVEMGNEYYSMMEEVHLGLVNQTSYITDIFYNDLKTYIIVEINSSTFNRDELTSILDFLSFNNQFCQLFAGVEVEDIQFTILVLDDYDGTPIAEFSVPQR